MNALDAPTTPLTWQGEYGLNDLYKKSQDVAYLKIHQVNYHTLLLLLPLLFDIFLQGSLVVQK